MDPNSEDMLRQQTSSEDPLRQQALLQLRKKREFYSHLLAYLFINAALVAIWFALGRHHFFWPIFPILGWGMGLFFHAWDTFGQPPSEERIRREMTRLRPRGPSHA